MDESDGLLVNGDWDRSALVRLGKVLQEGREGSQVSADLTPHFRKNADQGVDAVRVEGRRVDVAHQMTELPILVQVVRRFCFKNRRSRAWQIKCHLPQQLGMPALSAQAAAIELGGDQVEDPFEARVEAMQVQCDGVEVGPFVYLRMPRSLPMALDGRQSDLEFFDLLLDPLSQRLVASDHSTAP